MSITVLAQQANNENYYYYKGKQIYLTADSCKFVVIAKSEPNAIVFQNQGMQVFGSYVASPISSTIVKDKSAQNLNVKGSTYTTILQLSNKQVNTSKIVDKLKNTQEVIQVLPVFENKGKYFWATNNINVKLTTIDDTLKLQEYAKDYSLEIIGVNEYMPLWYMLTCTDETPFSSLKISNVLYESGDFVTVEPELCGDMVTFSGSSSNEEEILDPEYDEQWALKNTGFFENTETTPGIDINIEEAWNLATGEGTKVAVIDTGVDDMHPDLKDNMDSLSYDAEVGSQFETDIYSHGTYCAGVIAAVHNDIGIRGVAPNTQIMSGRFIESDLDNPYTADSITKIMRSTKIANVVNWAWQNGADILNCSWHTRYPSQMLDDAIVDALMKGREGKGCVVVFAAGNDGYEPLVYPCTIHPNLLNVGGLDYNGYRNNGENNRYKSDYGTDLDVMAPGFEICTTNCEDIRDTDSIKHDYIHVTGTSLACSHVSGLAALILSVNPELKGYMVNDIIESTARKVRSEYYDYSCVAGRKNGLWNIEMGYGLIDATSAVKRALETKYIVNNQITKNDTISGYDVIIENTRASNDIDLLIRKRNKAKLKSKVFIPKGATLKIENLNENY